MASLPCPSRARPPGRASRGRSSRRRRVPAAHAAPPGVPPGAARFARGRGAPGDSTGGARHARPWVITRNPAASRAASRPTFSHRTRRKSAGAPPARRRSMPSQARSRRGSPPGDGSGRPISPLVGLARALGGLPRRGRRAGLTRLARKPAPTGPPSRRARRLPHMENEGARRRRAAPRRPLARASPSAVRIVPLSPEPRRSEPIPLAPPHAPATRPEASYPLLTCAARWPAPTT
jgi:hypothetical protein